MDILILFKIFFFVFLLTKKTTCSNNCIPAKCSLNSSEIMYPFQIQGLQPNQCGLPDFKLFCKQNKTMINFPTYGDLVVKSIFYDIKKFNLLDPKNCVHEVFLNLNLSLTPFSYYYVLKQYKYINCSAKLLMNSNFLQVPCLSGSTYHVYIVEPSFLVPISCNFVKSVAIPFSYSPYLSDNSFGLGLTWNSTGEVEEEAISGFGHGLRCEMGRVQKYFKASGIVIAFIFLVGMMHFYVTIPQYCKEFNGKKVKELQEECEALNRARDTKENIKLVIY